MHKITGLFGIPIYQSHIDISEGLREHIRSQEFHRFGKDNGSCTRDVHLLEQPELADLRREIMRHVEFYVRDELAVAAGIEFYLTNSWCTRHLTGDESERHNHSNGLVSGVVYTDCDEQSGEFRFFKDYTWLNLWPSALDLDSVGYNEFNSKYWAIQPRVGDIILFPSHLAHGVSPSTSPNHRHCVAFNLFARGTIGLGSNPEITRLDLN